MHTTRQRAIDINLNHCEAFFIRRMNELMLVLQKIFLIDDHHDMNHMILYCHGFTEGSWHNYVWC